MLRIRTLETGEGLVYKDVRLRALLDSPSAFCSTYADESTRTDAAWAERLENAHRSGKDLPLVALSGNASVGMLWAKVAADDPSKVNLFQMWVAPEARGQGLAQALIERAKAWARSLGASTLALEVTAAGSPAATLYAKMGFLPVGGAGSRQMELGLESDEIS